MEKLALGTVQLGIPYGAANTTGMPTETAAAEIVRTAVESGVTFLDTAAIYGKSEERIGSALHEIGLSAFGSARPAVVTKVRMVEISDPMQCPDEGAAVRAVDESVATSQRRLRTPKLDVVLLHSYAGHSEIFGGACWRRLLELQQRGEVGRVGVSCYTPEEALALLRDPRVQHIQLPFNLLDARYKTTAFATAAAARPDVTIHTRSCFLQGILVGGLDRWPPFAQASGAEVLGVLDGLCRRLGRSNRVDLCLAYSRGVPWITQVLVGAETTAQLLDTMHLFGSTAGATPPPP
jgi:aryl-alcohol dehydrogenase-like predicted oxidoreductase